MTMHEQAQRVVDALKKRPSIMQIVVLNLIREQHVRIALPWRWLTEDYQSADRQALYDVGSAGAGDVRQVAALVKPNDIGTAGGFIWSAWPAGIFGMEVRAGDRDRDSAMRKADQSLRENGWVLLP